MKIEVLEQAASCLTGHRNSGKPAAPVLFRRDPEGKGKHMTVKNEKAYEKVIEHIKNEIWKGTLKRGERLPPERDLADALGVSRNSVREAIRTLGLMGFVSSTQGAGNFVTCDIQQNMSESLRMMLLLGETNYLQISQLRCGLESENARLAAERIMPKQIARLQELVRLMREEENPQKATAYDQEFHILLCEASGNRLIKSIFGAMINTFNDFIHTMYLKIATDPEQFEALHTSHEKLVNALAAHDSDLAVQAVWRHFEVVEASIRQDKLL